MGLTNLLLSPLQTQATTSSTVDLGTMFGVDADQVHDCCQGDRSSEIKQLAFHGDQVLHELVCERALPVERQRYEANSMLSWFLREGSNLTEYLRHISVSSHSDHSLGTVFEALLFQAAGLQQRVAVSTFMDWIDERWKPNLSSSKRPKLKAVAHGRAISIAHASSTEDVAVLAQLGSWEEESWAWVGSDDPMSESKLRQALSEVHNAFVATRLGDVQEELELVAALAASRREEDERRQQATDGRVEAKGAHAAAQEAREARRIEAKLQVKLERAKRKQAHQELKAKRKRSAPSCSVSEYSLEEFTKWRLELLHQTLLPRGRRPV